MKTHIGSALIAIALAVPLSADIPGATTKQLNFPAFASEMTIGPDGNIWIRTDSGNLGRITPDGAYKEFPLQFGLGRGNFPNAAAITSGIDGNLWVTGLNGHIERVTTSGTVTDFAVASIFDGPATIVSGADGALWFFNHGGFPPTNWKLGRIDIYGQVNAYDLGSTDQLRGLVSGGDGNLWFVNDSKNQVVKFSIVTRSMAGVFPIPSASNQDGDGAMAVGPDGNLWLTRGNAIDRVKVDGTITEFHVPSGGKPAAIALGADANIWFTEPSSARLGQLVVSSITSGGNATINETGAILANAYDLFALPARFAASAKSGTLGMSIPCPGILFVSRDSPPVFGPSNAHGVSAPGLDPCDQANLSAVFLSEVTDQDIQDEIDFEVDVVTFALTGAFSSNVHPFSQAPIVTAVVNLTAGPGVSISRVESSDPSAIVSISGLSATISSAVPEGSRMSAKVRLARTPGTPRGTMGGGVVISSKIVDPNPGGHVKPLFLDPSSSRLRVAIPPLSSDIVLNPFQRGR